MKIAGRTRRGTATPRWDWSGVDEVRVPEVCGESLQKIYEMLPVRHSSPQQLASEISALGARYHRYLHQDEFGPTRAECMAALGVMQTRVGLLDSLIGDLPQHLALELTYGSAESDQSLSFQVLRSRTVLRGWTLEQIHEAASTELGLRYSLHTADDLGMLQEICARAAAAMEVVSLLDTDSKGELFDDALSTGLLIAKNEFSVIDAPLCALKTQVGLTLDRLTKRKGPERQVSLSWLVWEACDLWTRETGEPVTNSSVRNGDYTGSPESPAGRFVLAIVEALQPCDTWMTQHLRVDASVRALKFAS